MRTLSGSRSTSTPRRGVSHADALALLFVGTILPMLCVTWLGCGVTHSREAARRVHCKNQLKQIVLALHNNHDVDRFFPPGSTTRASWLAHILPFVDQNPIYQIVDPRNGIAPTTNSATINVFLCPSSVETSSYDGETNYLASSGRQLPRDAVDDRLRGVFRDESHGRDGLLKTNVADPASPDYPGWSHRGDYFSFRRNVDGAANTLAVGETARGRIHWCPPFDPNVNQTIGWMTGTGDGQTINAVVSTSGPKVRSLFSSEHAGGSHFAAVDGGVHFVSAKIDPDLFAALLTIAGEENVEIPNP